jgi:tetratricopeptide (TPR) repeat protein
MRRRSPIRVAASGSSLAAASVFLAAAAFAQPDTVAPTFNRDVAPILWNHCASCHRDGQVAPFPLLSYSEVVPRARELLRAVTARTMPPWLPSGSDGRFENERRLTDADIGVLERWLRAGTPEGAESDRQTPPVWPDGWRLGRPDLVVTIPEPFTLQAGTSDVFRNFAVPVPIAAARWVRGIEVNPGEPRAVHHASISIDRTRASRRLDDRDPGPGFGGGMLAETVESPDSRALGWTPGTSPKFEPPGMAWRLPTDTDLVIQLHMIPPATGQLSITPSVAFYFTSTPPVRPSMDIKLGSRDIDIAAGDATFTIEDTLTLPVDVELLSVYPHAHYLAKEMNAAVTFPNGRRQPLLQIRDWDFHWQEEYRYRAPLMLPRGAVISMRYRYDNSAGNRRNPRPVPTRVVFGPLSSDEMGDLWMRMSPLSTDGSVALAAAYLDHEREKELRLNERMVVRFPTSASWHNALGASYLQAGRVAEAMTRLQQALQLAPDLAEAHNNLGQAFRRSGQPREAITALRRAVQLAPANAVAHLNFGNALEDNGDLTEAIAAFEQALALNPSLAEAHNNIGIALGALGHLEAATVRFRAALDIDPGYADARRNLAMIEELQQRPAVSPG